MDKQPVGQLPDLTQSNNDDEIMVITNSEYNQLKKEKISDLITDFTSTNENNALTKGTDGKMFVTDFGNASNITEGTLPTSVLPEIPLEKIPDIPKDKLPPIETADLPVSGVTADTYAYPSSVTVNAQGQVIAIEEGTPSGSNANVDLSNITDAGKEVIKKNSGGSGLEVGDIGIAALGIDETKGLRRYLNGQILTANSNTQGFINKLKSAAALYPSLVCTEAEWQEIVTNSDVGQCGKFVINYDTDNTTVISVRLPKIIMPIQGLTDLSKLGQIVAAGLPNIEGTVTNESSYGMMQDNSATGAFYAHTELANGLAGNSTNEWSIGFDASLFNAIYGNSDTVQQEAIQYPYFIQIATGQETEVNITNEIELNNPFSLLDYKYSEYELNNLSWLKSTGQYNSKAIYPAVYDLLLKIYNGTETKAGVSVKLSTGSYTDYDFVLNTAEEAFRLPVKVKLSSTEVSGLYLYFYVGETVQNANLINAGRIEEKLSSYITKNDCSAYVVETFHNEFSDAQEGGANWYRIWSDGFIEQGGYVAPGATKTTVSFLVPYKHNNTINVQISESMLNHSNNDTGGYENVCAAQNITVNNFYVSCQNRIFNWRACGY